LGSRLITIPRGWLASSGSGFVRPRSGSGFDLLPPRRLSSSISAVVRANVVDKVIQCSMMSNIMLFDSDDVRSVLRLSSSMTRVTRLGVMG